MEVLNNEILEFESISKRFGGVQALQEVTFKINRGEIHALIGENGAGKTTLINLCGGVFPPDSGIIKFNGERITDFDTNRSKALGINIVHQEFALCPDLNVASNIFLGPRPPAKMGFLNFKSMNSISDDIFKQLGVKINLGQTLGDLTVGQQQIVEIAKSLSGNPKLIIMDEPTSALNLFEAETLFKVIYKLQKRGISIIYVSHRMEEVFRLADSITVLRDGKHVGTFKKVEVSPEKVITMMVGRKETELYPTTVSKIGKAILNGEKLNKGIRLKNVDFSLLEGEILGIAGLQGSGNSTLIRTIFGIEKLESGQIYLFGKKISVNSPEKAIANGIGYIPADRREEGIALLKSIEENIAYLNLKKISKMGFVRNQKMRKLSKDCVKELNIQTSGVNQLLVNLSGGNQQKVVVAKWLATKPKILLMDDPTRGIDVGAKAEIHALLNTLAKSGISIMLISSELPELIAMSNRIIVMYKGELVAELKKEEINQETVMGYATGAIVKKNNGK